MKKMNNKGFAISTMLYGLLIIIVLIVGMILSTMAFNRKNSKEYTSSIVDELEKRAVKVCHRATSLHKEVCTQTKEYSCIDKYGLNNEIEYGNLKSENSLVPGDAFDCDVNGDGLYDAATERFYYMRTSVNGENKSIDYLVYYKNYSGNTYANAIAVLPSVTQWPSVTVSSSSIYSNANRGARLLMEEDIEQACSYSNVSTSDTVVSLSKCKYLLESTSYANLNNSEDAYWIYTSDTSSSMGKVVDWYSYYSKVNSSTLTPEIISSRPKTGFYLVRPVIEVSRDEMEL